MYTKSTIQQRIEGIEKTNMFFENLEYIMNKYDVENAIFTPQNHTILEATQGYFEITGEYDNLENLKKNYDNEFPYVRIMENNTKFQTGKLHKTINDISEDSENLGVYDIHAQKLINSVDD